MSLKEKILRTLRATGPITVAQYMRMALGDPEHGYYVTSDPLGRDFITAPEISQIFGELIGLFLVQAWDDRGAAPRFDLVELGPGRGTLMSDALRAAERVRRDFVAAAQITLVETSPALRAVQAAKLVAYDVRWSDHFHDIEGGRPLFVIANEFFDALAIRQFVRGPRGWHERVIVAEGDNLAFALTPDCLAVPFIPAHLRQAPEGEFFEYCPEGIEIARALAARIAGDGGVGLFVDYGHEESFWGDTLQAVKRHAFADPLAEPGSADLTAHVDFGALGLACAGMGAATHGPITQAAFLGALGIGVRAARLAQVTPAKAPEIDGAIQRLIHPDQMGTLFKVMVIAQAGTPTLPGLPHRHP